MINDILVVDNFLTQDQQNNIEQLILSHRVGWQFFLDKGNNITPGLVTSVYETTPKAFQNNYYYPHLRSVLDLACAKINLHIDKLIQVRPFIQLPVVEKFRTEHNNIHLDQQFPHVVCVYYVNDSDGDTLIFDKDRRVTQRIQPKKGQAVFFNGMLEHASSCPKENLRMIVNYNFTIST
jgi:hypothetical protein